MGRSPEELSSWLLGTFLPLNSPLVGIWPNHSGPRRLNAKTFVPATGREVLSTGHAQGDQKQRSEGLQTLTGDPSWVGNQTKNSEWLRLVPQEMDSANHRGSSLAYAQQGTEGRRTWLGRLKSSTGKHGSCESEVSYLEAWEPLYPTPTDSSWHAGCPPPPSQTLRSWVEQLASAEDKSQVRTITSCLHSL